MTLRRMLPRVLPFAFLGLIPLACQHPGADPDAFRWTNQLPAGAVVHIRNGAGNIIVKRAAGPDVVVSGSRRWKRSRESDIRFVVNQIGNDYYVCAMWHSSGKCGPSGYRGRRVSALLTMFSLFHRNNDAVAGFVAELPAGVIVDASTVTGNVEVSGATAGVVAHAVNGNVSAVDVAGPIAASTTNGNIEISAASLSPSDSVHLSSINGNVTVNLPPATAGYFDLRTTNGSLRTDLPIQTTSGGSSERHLTGQVGGSNRSVRLRTVNGDAVVTTRGAPASQSQ